MKSFLVVIFATVCCGISSGAVDSWWNGKQVAFLGDSITDPSMSETSYWGYLAQDLGFTPYVYAVAGNEMLKIKGQAQKLKAEHPDIDAIFILAGGNDYFGNCPLGKWYYYTQEVSNWRRSQELAPRRHFDLNEDTFRGRINLALDYVKDNFPDAQVIMMTPLHRGFADFQVGDNAQPDETFGNPSGLHIGDYVNVVREAASVWSVPVIDLHATCGLFPAKESFVKYCKNSASDRLHPNPLGHWRIAETIKYWLLARPANVVSPVSAAVDCSEVIAQYGEDACIWINGDTSSAQDWRNEDNWYGGRVPAAGDDVIVPSGACIDLGGAEIGSIIHLDGILSIDSGLEQMTLRGGLTSTGTGVGISNTPILLTAGEHVISNACAVTHDQASVFSGADVCLVKAGAGSFGLIGESVTAYAFTGELKVLEGSFTTGSGWKDYLFNGLTKCTVSGELHIENFNKVNSSVELYIEGKGRITWSGNYNPYAFTVPIRKLFYNGQPCAAGSWGAYNAPVPAHRSLFVSTTNYKAALVVAEGPEDGGYNGLDGYDSGVDVHWTGAVSSNWTLPENWRDGIVAGTLDDVFIDADAEHSPNYPASLVVHDFTDRQGLNVSYPSLTVYGNLDAGTGTKTFANHSLSFGSSCEHVLTTEGAVKMGVCSFSSGGPVVKRGAGTLEKTKVSTDYSWSWSGGLTVEAGGFSLPVNTTIPGCKDVTVSGKGATLTMQGENFPADAVLSISGGGRVSLVAGLVYCPKTLVLDGVTARAGRSYGSRQSAAQWQDDDHFSNTGVVCPGEDETGGVPLADAQLTVDPIGSAYYYGDEACTPAVVVRDARGGGEVVTPENYTVTYLDNAAYGTATVIVLGRPGTKYEALRVMANFAIEHDPDQLPPFVWINSDTSAVQDWKVAANWADVDGDGIGDVPPNGADIIFNGNAKLSLAGADIGSIRQTAGTLTISSSSVSMTLRRGIIATGSGVTITSSPIVLTAGDHLISNACDLLHNDKTTWSGTGASLTIRGKGKFGISNAPTKGVYKFTGPITVYEGSFTEGTGSSGCVMTGPSALTISGPTAWYELKNNGLIGSEMTLSVENGGRIKWAAGYADRDYSMKVKRLYLDGQACVAGEWRSAAAAPEFHRSSAIVTTYATLHIDVAEGPTEGGYEGDTEMWSGRVRHWTGAVDATWATVGNWQEGEAPNFLDDIVISASAERVPNKSKNWAGTYHHHVRYEKTGNIDAGKPCPIYGDLYVTTGKKTCGWTTLSFPRGRTHEIFVEEGGNLYLYNASIITGGGDVVKRGKGMIQAAMRGERNYWGLSGNLTIEDGTIDILDGVLLPKIASVTVRGKGATMILRGADLPTNAVVRLERGGTLQLVGTHTNAVRELWLDGVRQRGRTYGSSASAADKHKDVYFSGNGVLDVAPEPVPGFMMFIQ